MTAIDRQRERIARRLSDPDMLTFPEGWTMSTSWQRAQMSDGVIGPVNPAEWDILLGSGDCYRVLFAIYDGELRAECACDGYRYRDFCAHVARLWWRWVRHDLVVADLDTGRNYTAPPGWLDVRDDDVRPEQTAAADTPRQVRADGGRTCAESARGRASPSGPPTGGCHAYTDTDPETQHGDAIDRVMRDRQLTYETRGSGGDSHER